MTLILNGTDGLSDVDGSAATPAIRGTDANTGIFFPAADTIAFAEGGAEIARFDSSGNFGIGTSSPTNKLQVSGNVRGTAFYVDGGAYLGSAGSDTLTFIAGSSERARIDSLGSLLINATSNGYGVTGGIYAPSVYGFTTASAANMHIENGGFMRRSTSSLKYKTDVQDATHGLAKVMQLRPVTYKGINDGDKVFGGLIAEEVHEAGLTEFVQYAEDGSPDALAYGNMVSLCVKAFQEMKAIIDTQASTITQLQADVEALKAQP